MKQNLDIDPNNTGDITNKVLVTLFSMMAELERDLISERIKEGQKARKANGIKLGKPKGTIQALCMIKTKGGFFIHRKVKKGKSKRLVINAVRNKVMHRVFACVRDNRKYEKTILLSLLKP